jgi:hypothetical protein
VAASPPQFLKAVQFRLARRWIALTSRQMRTAAELAGIKSVAAAARQNAIELDAIVCDTLIFGCIISGRIKN